MVSSGALLLASSSLLHDLIRLFSRSGQGLNTKVAQACAMALQVPIELITVVNTTTLVNPNNGPTGGSITSEACVNSAMNACAGITALLAPFRAKTPAATWVQLCAAAIAAGVDLRVAAHSSTFRARFCLCAFTMRCTCADAGLLAHDSHCAAHDAGHVPDLRSVDCGDVRGPVDGRVPDPAG